MYTYPGAQSNEKEKNGLRQKKLIFLSSQFFFYEPTGKEGVVTVKRSSSAVLFEQVNCVVVFQSQGSGKGGGFMITMC